ncbi:MAG: hypothetical protein ACREX8_20390, partial [Gammaproteobacteria bacterium]
AEGMRAPACRRRSECSLLPAAPAFWRRSATPLGFAYEEQLEVFVTGLVLVATLLLVRGLLAESSSAFSRPARACSSCRIGPPPALRSTWTKKALPGTSSARTSRATCSGRR